MGEIEGIALSKHGSDDWAVEYVQIIDPWLQKYRFDLDDQKVLADGLEVRTKTIKRDRLTNRPNSDL